MANRHGAQPPLSGRYWCVVAVALLALVPFIVLSTAAPLLQPGLQTSLHLTLFHEQLAEGLAQAGYAFGAVLAAWLVQRFLQRRLFLLTEAVFVLGSTLAATAPDQILFIVGSVLQGAATGLMLVIALPPVITRFGAERMPSTAVAVNLGLFGAVSVGPLIGGLAGTGTSWRIVYAAVAALGAVGFLLALVTLERFPPFNPDQPADNPGFALALGATVLPFFGVSHLVDTGFADPVVWAPVAAGVVLLVALLVTERARADALMPVRPMQPALPLTGLFVAMLCGAVFVAAFELLAEVLTKAGGLGPLRAGELFWPAVPGVVIGAVVFGRLLRTRWVPVQLLAGLLLLCAATGLLSRSHTHPVVLASCGMLGLAAGSSVSPGLFLAAWAVRSNLVGRVFAQVELLRAEAAYLVGPVLVHLAEQHYVAGRPKPDLSAGFTHAASLDFWVAVTGTAIAVFWWLGSGARLQRPDIATWLDTKDQPGLSSPPSMALLRGLVSPAAAGRHEDTAHALR